MRIQVVPIADYDKLEAENAALAARLAEAESLLREARRKIRDIDGMTTSQFVDEGIGLSGLDLLKGIDAFLAADSASHRENDV